MFKKYFKNILKICDEKFGDTKYSLYLYVRFKNAVI